MSKKILVVNSSFFISSLALCLTLGLGCSDDTAGTGSSSAGATGTGGSSTSGSSSKGGSGGTSSSASGGKSSVGGSSTTVDSTSSGGKTSVGGSSTTVSTSTGKGGSSSTSAVAGSSSDGGTSASGGTSKTGGTTGSGTTSATAGSTTKTGGTSAVGGSAVGGSATGGTSTGGTGGGTSTGTGTAGGEAKPSDGCGKDPTGALKSAVVGQATPVNTISGSRQFLVRWPTNYDNKKPYPLHIGLHGATGNLGENGKDNFGLWSLSKDGMIFVTLAGVATSNPNQLFWDGPRDLLYADAVLKQVESELCIDTSRVFLEGFSQGAAMSWFLTGSRPGVFRAVIGHSGGGVSGAPAFKPVAYLGSLGTGEGGGQNTQTDQFAKANGCTIETLPRATTGNHVCTPYKGCKEGFPTVWCSYDGGHGFQDTDAGSSKTWMPQVSWDFLTPLL